MILVDFSQMVVSSVAVNFTKEHSSKEDLTGLIRHMVFSMILNLKQKLGKSYGKIILCCDSRRYWRREYFPYYKGHRSHSKDESPFDWQLVYDVMDQLKKDIAENFNYQVIDVSGAEADDVIACLTKYLSENELEEGGLFGGNPQKICIVSSDGDFCQLQKYDNVVQWNNQHKKWVSEPNPKKYLIEHIIRGDGGDNIPSVLTSNKWAEDRANNVKAARAKSITEAQFERLSTTKLDDLPENEKSNWIRNRTLIDFDYIPPEVNDAIIDAYKNYEQKGSKAKIMNYFLKHKMKVMFSNVGEF